MQETREPGTSGTYSLELMDGGSSRDESEEEVGHLCIPQEQKRLKA